MSAATPAVRSSVKKSLAKKYRFSSNLASVGIVSFADPELRRFVAQGISAIGFGAAVMDGDINTNIENTYAVDKLTADELAGFDFFVTDGEGSVDTMSFMRAGLVPILAQDSVFSELLRDFDPMKFEGNGFFFADLDPYRVFEKIVSYKETTKFPEDRRILLRNVLATF
ncbi:MAG TPA: hypothetical protein PK765_01960 [bacterium]|nr:hypothetical protein [bacterium]